MLFMSFNLPINFINTSELGLKGIVYKQNLPLQFDRQLINKTSIQFCLNQLIKQFSKLSIFQMSLPINNQKAVSCSLLQAMSNIESLISNKTIIVSLRNDIIEWVYRAQKYLHFSRSTLHLTVGVLDKIIVNNFKIDKDNIELVSGSLLLICSKLNQKSYLSVRRINSMLKKDKDHCSRDYIQMQAIICQTLNYNILPDSVIYEKFCELEVNCAKENFKKCQQLVKIALMSVTLITQRNGIMLLQAVDRLLAAGLYKDSIRNYQYDGEIQLIQSQLKRFHTMTHR